MTTETDITIRIDPARFPGEYWTSEHEPFDRIDDNVLASVHKWTRSQIPNTPCAVELSGYVPAPVIARISKALCESGVVEEFYMYKPRTAVCRVW